MNNKKIYLVERSAFDVDFDKHEIKYLPSDREAIQSIRLLNEDCVVTDGEVEYEANKGDILIIFYTTEFKHRFVIAKSEEWAENIIKYRKTLEEARLQSEKNCDDCKECDNTCCPTMA